MTSLIWPAALPIPKLNGLEAEYQKAFIRTDMDAGPAKQRLRYTAVPKQFTAVITVTEAKRELFDSFFTSTLSYGTLRFVMKNPQTLATEEFRFTDTYKEKENGAGLWDITMPLERLP